MSIIKMKMARRAAKYLSQACKNFLPAQGAKMEVRKSANELIYHKLQIFDFLLHSKRSAPCGLKMGRPIKGLKILHSSNNNPLNIRIGNQWLGVKNRMQFITRKYKEN